MSEEIKACPFCGGKHMTQTVSFSDGYQEGDPVYLKCRECHSRTGMWDKQSEAIAAWNRRTPDPAQFMDDVEVLVGALAEIERRTRKMGGWNHHLAECALATALAKSIIERRKEGK